MPFHPTRDGYVMQLRQVYHTEWLSETVTLSSPLVPGFLQRMQAAMHLPDTNAVLAVLSLFVQQKAEMAAIDDSFLVATVIVFVAVPLVFLLGRKRVEAARIAETRRLDELSPGTYGERNQADLPVPAE